MKERDTNEKQEDLEVANDNINNEYIGEVTGYAVPMNHVQDRIKDQKMSQFSGFGHSGVSGYGQGGILYFVKNGRSRKYFPIYLKCLPTFSK